MKKKIRITAYGFDGGVARDIGLLFLKECSKTLVNGSCPGHHNHVVIVWENEEYNDDGKEVLWK